MEVVPASSNIQGMQGNMCPQSLEQRLSPALETWSWAVGILLLRAWGGSESGGDGSSPDLKPLSPVFLALFLFSVQPAMAGPGIHGTHLVAQQVSYATHEGHGLGLGDPWCNPCCL